MDSTKKITKKLAGKAAGTASWMTNVGNEFGVGLMTTGKRHGLQKMADRLVQRYKNANEPPPKLMYVDRDCCSMTGKSEVSQMYSQWPELTVRLDIWHFMRRFTAGCTTESHQLYGLFMSTLSNCIFEWDSEDLEALKTAKRAELGEGFASVSDEVILEQISRKELERHCRRRTRGVQQTTSCIQELIDVLSSDSGRDTMGFPLFHAERIQEVWAVQQRHVKCIQDLQDFPLYTEIGTITKGGHILKTYRCARGSTSLESFHSHLKNFVPGTAANAQNFQAYVLEGLTRWNEDRIAASVSHPPQKYRSYNAALLQTVNELTTELFGQAIDPCYAPPAKYSGEKIGIDYLFDQTGQPLSPVDFDSELPEIEDEVRDFEDEGFVDLDPTILSASNDPRINVIIESQSEMVCKEEASTSWDTQQQATTGEDQPSTSGETSAVGPKGVPGYDRVQRLADFLVSIRDQTFISDTQADKIKTLWDDLLDMDKEKVTYHSRFRTKLVKGRYKHTHMKSKETPGIESVKRSMIGMSTGPSNWPDCSRLVEAICSRLCALHRIAKISGGTYVTRWTFVIRDYSNIRQLILQNHRLMSETSLQLFQINQTTLTQWHNKKMKEQETTLLRQGLPQWTTPVASTPLLHSKPLLPQRQIWSATPFAFLHPAVSTIPIGPTQQQQDRRFVAAQSQQLDDSPTPSERIPRSTAFYRRKKLERGEGRTYAKHKTQNCCKTCGQPRRVEFGHKCWRGYLYCPRNPKGLTYDQWRAELPISRATL